MKIVFYPDECYSDSLCAATIGVFDGLHLGHRHLLDRLKSEAAKQRLKSMVVTFERPPRQVVHPDWRPELLTTLDEKIRLMDKTGIDVLVILRFNQYMAGLSAHDFMKRVLFGQLNVRLLLTGYDNRFGHDRTEGFDDYRRYGEAIGIEVVCGDPLTVGTSNASSSRIRHLLKEGLVEEARQCLGRPYALSGLVVHGEQIGRKIGFPTANMMPADDKIIPADGVYAVMVRTEGHALKRGITNIGTRPTFNGRNRTLETNIFDETGNFYERSMTICFISRLRDERPFPSGEALADQIRKDKKEAEKRLNLYEQKS
jgi:riboflavin kinase/FMN adenylyltransferase